MNYAEHWAEDAAMISLKGVSQNVTCKVQGCLPFLCEFGQKVVFVVVAHALWIECANDPRGLEMFQRNRHRSSVM